MKQVEEQCKYWINNVPPNAPSGCIPAPKQCEACKRFSRLELKPSEASAEALRVKKYKPEEKNKMLLTEEEILEGKVFGTALYGLKSAMLENFKTVSQVQNKKTLEKVVEILKSIKLEVQDKKGRGVWKTNVYDAYGIAGRIFPE